MMKLLSIFLQEGREIAHAYKSFAFYKLVCTCPLLHKISITLNNTDNKTIPDGKSKHFFCLFRSNKLSLVKFDYVQFACSFNTRLPFICMCYAYVQTSWNSCGNCFGNCIQLHTKNEIRFCHG